MQPWKKNPLLCLSYTLLSPVYDRIIETPTRKPRLASLAALPCDTPGSVLISGVGTGLDLPHLPALHQYLALDFNRSMLSRARRRVGTKEVMFVLGDSMALPLPDASMDHVILHLIVAVVPEPGRALGEAARVLKPGGTILLFDKFLRKGERAPLRRLLNGVARRIATRTDVVLEDLLDKTPGLEVISDIPALGRGWFRRIVLRKARS